jgi:hypothetical protein
MRTIVFLGKRSEKVPDSPKPRYPGSHLAGVTHANVRKPNLPQITDWDTWWDIHPIKRTRFADGTVYEGIENLRPKALGWYRKLPGPGQHGYRPLYMLEHYPDIPASVRFPVEDVVKAFPVFDELAQAEPGFFATCQVDYMMAWAILQGYEHIVLAGHGVSQDPEHMIAHRGILYWRGFAEGRGLRMTVHRPSWYRCPQRLYAVTTRGWKAGDKL